MNEREVVLEILLDIEKNGTFSNIAIGKALRKSQFEEKRKRSFIMRLAEGVTEKRYTLDRVIDMYSKTKVNKLKPLIRVCLRMGIYQMLYMDSVPERAAIYETVGLVKSHGMKGLSGFVNAVLRSVGRNRDEVMGKIEKDPLLKYSVPKWLYEYINDLYGEENTAKVFESGEKERPTSLRVNCLKTGRDELMAKLSEAGITAEKGKYSDSAILISDYDFIRKVPGFRNGEFTVQDESSQVAVRTAFDCFIAARDERKHNNTVMPEVLNNNDDPFENENISVIDMCAAPGGKTTYISELIEKSSPGKGKVLSFDISEDKTDLILENVERLGLTNVDVSVSDATGEREDLYSKADIVIADVPCSGLGIMGRKNDIKYRVKDTDIEELRAMADTILDNAVKYLKPGGILLFSTCTITKTENEEASEALMRRHHMLTKLSEHKYIQGVDMCDGFYFSVFRNDQE